MPCNTINRVLRGVGRAVKRMAGAVTKTVRNIDIASVKASLLGWLRKLKQFINDHRDTIIRILVTSAVVVIIIVLIVKVLPILLAALGFTASGVAVGSFAAGVQSALGNVAAGSLFAILTSFMMGGYGVYVVYGVVAAIGYVLAAVGNI